MPDDQTAPKLQHFSLTGHVAGTSSASGELTNETWHDWFPDIEPTLTIEDVVANVRLIGADGTESVTIDKVRFWQRKGVLPAPIRRKIGEGKGRARALYPEQAVNAVTLICLMQYRGVPLRKLNGLVARSLTSMARERGQETEQDTALLDAVIAAAQRQARRTGSPVRKVEITLDGANAEVTFTDERDRKHSHTLA